jgi:NADH-quinone oxidoreductase subunit B
MTQETHSREGAKSVTAPHATSREDILTTRLEAVVEFLRNSEKRVENWSRKNSLWPLPFATACCGIELMATAASRYDLARFGAEVMRFSPRQADLMICAGRVAIKMMPVLQRIYMQMCEPKWVISMGACACTGGVFDTYAVVQGIDQFLPVDVYVPGCPPRPETLIEGVMAIQRIVEREGIRTSRERGRGYRLAVQETYQLHVPTGSDVRATAAKD